MVVSYLARRSAYFNLSPGIRCALEFLQQADVARLTIGRHAVDGDRVFALVSEYHTQPIEARFWEAHRQHIDVQFVQSGIEQIAVGDLADFDADPYDAERDLIVARGAAAQFVTLRSGMFAILFPHDVHMPGLIARRVERVRKVVVKVRD